MRFFFIAGTLFCGIAVALGAFGAHALKPHLTEYGLTLWDKATYYQMIHGFAILFATLTAFHFKTSKYFNIATILFTAGIFFFAGSLYTIALTNIRALGMIAPIGGVSFMVGWFFLLLGCYSASSQSISPKGA